MASVSRRVGILYTNGRQPNESHWDLWWFHLATARNLQEPITSRSGNTLFFPKKLPVSGRSPTSLEACMTEILINCAQKGGTDKNTTEENPKFDVTNTSINEAYSQIQSFYRSSDLPAFALRSQHHKNKHVISLCLALTHQSIDEDPKIPPCLHFTGIYNVYSIL